MIQMTANTDPYDVFIVLSYRKGTGHGGGEGQTAVVSLIDGGPRSALRSPRQLVDAERDQIGHGLGQFHVDLQHFLLADRHGAFVERVLVVGQRIATRVQRAGYGQRTGVRRPGHDGHGRDGYQVFGRVVVHQRGAADAASLAAGGCVPGLVRGQPARLDVRVHETAERSVARVREHRVVRRLVVVLVPPAHGHGALEPVPFVLERRG